MTLEQLEKDLAVKRERYVVLSQMNTSSISEAQLTLLRLVYQQAEIEYLNADKALRAKVLELMDDTEDCKDSKENQ
jgi:hypothetical protein